MSKHIECQHCSEYLGEIRDAKLRKDILYICSTCYDMWIPDKVERPKKEYTNKKKIEDDATVAMLRNMFGMK